MPHILTPNSGQLKPHSHHHELPILGTWLSPFYHPSFFFCNFSSSSINLYTLLHLPFLFPTSQLSTLTFIPLHYCLNYYKRKPYGLEEFFFKKPTNYLYAAAAKSLQSCPTLCDPHRRPPIRLPRPWDSPGKNTGVGCHFLLQCMKVKSESEVAQSCPTLSNPMDCSLPGSSIHGIFQARVLE